MKTIMTPVVLALDFVNLKTTEHALFFVTDEDPGDEEPPESAVKNHKELCYQVGMWVIGMMAPSLSNEGRHSRIRPLWEEKIGSTATSDYDLHDENWDEILRSWICALEADMLKTSAAKFSISHKIGTKFTGNGTIGVDMTDLY
jgi:hypothetical protein